MSFKTNVVHKVSLNTIHSQLNVVLSGECVVCDGDFDLVRPFIW